MKEILKGVTKMGNYEEQLMNTLDEEEKRITKKERKDLGWESSGDGRSIRRSGCYHEDYREWD